jgi:glutathione S-transferase
MKLTSSIGPNPRVVTLFMAEKDMTLETIKVDIMAGENRQPVYLAKNPTGGTPLLELDDGTALSESTAICEYLEELHPTPPLIGTTPEERAETRMWVRRIDLGYVQPAVHGFRGAEGLPLFQSRMRCVPEGAAGMKAVAQDGLAMIDAQLAKGTFVCGERLTLADLLLFSFVDFGATVGQPADPSLAHLAAWRARIAERPSAAA